MKKKQKSKQQQKVAAGSGGGQPAAVAAEPDVVHGAEPQRDGVARGPVALARRLQPPRLHHRRAARRHPRLLHDPLHRRGRLRPRLQGLRRRQDQAGARRAARRRQAARPRGRPRTHRMAGN
jgi:hypothetical protein